MRTLKALDDSRGLRSIASVGIDTVSQTVQTDLHIKYIGANHHFVSVFKSTAEGHLVIGGIHFAFVLDGLALIYLVLFPVNGFCHFASSVSLNSLVRRNFIIITPVIPCLICAVSGIFHTFYVIIDTDIALFQLILQVPHLPLNAPVIQSIALAIVDEAGFASRVPLKKSKAGTGIAVTNRIKIRFRLDIRQ